MYKQNPAPLVCSELEFSMLFRIFCTTSLPFKDCSPKLHHCNMLSPLMNEKIPSGNSLKKPFCKYGKNSPNESNRIFFSSWHHKSHFRVRLRSCCSRDICKKTNFNFDMTKQQIIFTNLDDVSSSTQNYAKAQPVCASKEAMDC